MTKIIDVIHHRNKYGTQVFVVIDEMPDIKYQRVGKYLIGECDGFFNFYRYEKPGKAFQAFAGRCFDIPLIDGGIEKANGQWWDCIPDDYQDLIGSVGANTPENLSTCNVFFSYKVDPDLVNDWLENNEPSNNYRKYDSRDKSFGIHTIVSQWDIAA